MGTVDPASVGNGDMDGGYLVHRGTTIYPDATGYYDGPAEFSDLPSSIYHNQAKTVSGLSAPGLNGGDGRLGEVTSPANTSQFGQDRGSGNPTGNKPTDGLIGPGGPGAYNLSGQNGYDAGNVLNLEYLTWFHAGASDPDYIPTTPVEALKRDYNLDGLLDQGAVRLPGTENYAWDDDSGNSNDGSPGEFYPFNRKRLTEGCRRGSGCEHRLEQHGRRSGYTESGVQRVYPSSGWSVPGRPRPRRTRAVPVAGSRHGPADLDPDRQDRE